MQSPFCGRRNPRSDSLNFHLIITFASSFQNSGFCLVQFNNVQTNEHRNGHLFRFKSSCKLACKSKQFQKHKSKDYFKMRQASETLPQKSRDNFANPLPSRASNYQTMLLWNNEQNIAQIVKSKENGVSWQQSISRTFQSALSLSMSALKPATTALVKIAMAGITSKRR